MSIFGGRRRPLVLSISGVVLFVCAAFALDAQERPLLRISVENYPDHVQTEAVRAFAEALQERLGGQFDVRFYDSGRLFHDRDVLDALSIGHVEVAVPGLWHVDRYERAVAAMMLPHCFGRSPEFIHALSDGALGRDLNRRMEQSLNVVVLGRWLDLGYAHLYFARKAVSDHQDIAGRRVRVAGGFANKLRLESLGAETVTIPWNDLPFYLRQRSVDGVLTTHETFRSGELWEYGLDHALEDFEYFAQYVPVMRRTFWNRLTDDQRHAVTEAWQSIVDDQRREAARAQSEARESLRRHGVTIVRPPDSELEATREYLLQFQTDMAFRLGIPRGVLRLLESAE